MKNKISYLGYLGIIGVIGLIIRSFTHSIFLVFFFFFGYAEIIPDELFKKNVRKSGFKAFVVNMSINFLVIIASSISATQPNNFSQLEVTSAITVAFILNFIISILTFIINLKYLDYKEKQILE